MNRFTLTVWFHTGEREPLIETGLPFSQLRVLAALWLEQGLIAPLQFKALLDQIQTLAFDRKRRRPWRKGSTIISSECGGWACEIERTK